MVKNNVYYEWFASITVPNPDQVGYWVDLGADSKGRIIKVYNRDIEKWVVLFDVSKDDYVPPFIGSNGNWWVDNRDTGVKATAEAPYIGENDHWFTYDPINKVYVDTGIEARGLSAYDIAVKLGFEGSEQDWIDSLSKASEDAAVAALDAANKANEAADKANQAVEEIEGIVDDAIAATDKAEEIASNPPKIVDNDWWIYDYDTKQYVNTGIAAIGDAFTYKKEYPSVEAMEADWGTADVKLGEYVLINTNDVEDPDDAKVYLKTQEGWKFIVDLSGMQGIQGWSAYEVAVKHGFVGTEEEWVQSLKQPALDAAAEALEAKAQVEATEKAVKEAEALRVTAEQGRVNAENTRVSNENTRISNENSRKAEESKRVTAENERIAAENSRRSEEDIRKTNEANRISAESSRASAETLRASAEVERNTNEQKRIEEETKRISSEEGRVAAETKRVDNEDARIAAETARDTAEQERVSNEATRQANEAIRETQEAAREKNTADAITAVNEAKTAAQQATTNATTAANNANTQANRAKEYADNPPKVGDDGYWYLWDEVDDVYVNTGWPSSGIILKGSLDSPEDLDTIVDPQLSDSYIVGTDLYFWNGTEWVNMGRFQGPQGEPGKDAELSKAAIEAVLIGEVTTHTHDTRYYTKDQTDANIKVVADDLANNYYNKSQVDSKFTSLGSYVSNVTGATADANAVAITLEKKNPTTGTADSSAITIDKATTSKAGVMSAADKTKLDAALEDTLAYWYENDENNSSTTCATGGNRNVIESLRNKFKRCIAKPYGDDAALISYCNESHSKKWPDNTDIVYTGRNQENMMVHFPKYYHKTIERSPGIWRTYISEQQIDSDYIEEPERLVGVYEAYKYSDINWLCSDGGVESTHSQTLATFVTQAKANGSMWGIQDYRIHATIARMFCAYYKTTNISTSNSSIPCSGGTKLYNAGKTGGTISLGNKDGRLATLEDSTHYSTSFLGLEDCYYSKWEFVQGINILKGKYVVYDGGSFPDKDVAELEAAGATNIRVVGYEPNPAATTSYSGWTKAIAQGKYGDVVPTAHGGSETTYYSDYSWFNPTANRIFLRSGSSDIGSRCGVFVAYALNVSSHSWTSIGARLAFYGKIVVVDSDTFKKMQA